ncbi:hypothetical protein [Anaerotignum sp.]|uniref:hypothetical protein n=1 Tax=Anaerotignum sp. TaxID=2039241 RepID=UPI0028AC4DDD|nr:hypothetical protein [Anaerotignum sp.]
MYPYNKNTQLYNTSLEIKEKTKETSKENQAAALAEDRRLLEILYMAQQETADLAERFASLMTDPKMADSVNILKAMYLDELKHINQLKEAYYLITNEKDEAMPKGTPPTISGQELLEDTLLLEIDNGDFYRTLHLTMPTQELRDLFFEISSDKMSHSNALTYLFSKYYAR